MIELNCPKCGAVLNINKKRDIIFCEYCGNKIMLDQINLNIDHNITYREIKDADVEKEKRIALESSNKLKSDIAIIIFCIIMLIMMIIVGKFL